MLTVPVPMKAHLNPAVLIGIDLFARRADHHRGLNSPDTRAARAYGRAVWQVGRHGLKLVAVGAALLVWCLFFQNLGLFALMMHAEQEPIAVQGGIGVVRSEERRVGKECKCGWAVVQCKEHTEIIARL